MRVAINGAGVAGPTLAYWLRRFGHEPTLFEKSAGLRTGGFVIDFWGPGYEVAERMGLIGNLAARSYAIESMRLVDANGKSRAVLNVRPIRAMLGGRLLSLARADIVSTLLAACQGIPTHFGSSIWNIEQNRNGVTIRLANGRLEHFDLLIGADGLHSQVRTLAFAPQIEAERALDCYVAAFRVDNYPRWEKFALVSHTSPGRYVARISLERNQTLILMVCRAKQLGGSPRHEQQKEALRWAFGDMKWEVPAILDAMEEASDLYFDRVSQIQLPSWSNGRIGLIGDAASCPSFLAGAGCALAMVQAYVLAGELCAAEGDHKRAFARYEERLRPLVRTMQRSARLMKGYFTPSTAVGMQLRDLIVHMISSPLVAKPFLKRTLNSSLELPPYPLV